MEVEGTNDWKPIFNTFILPKNKEKMLKEIRKNYFSEEELQIIEQLPRMGSDDKLAGEWIELIQDIKCHLDTDPTSKKAQALASQWISLVDTMYKGNRKLAQKAWKINSNKGEELGFYNFDSEIICFIENAIAYYYEQKQAGDLDESKISSP